MLEDPPFDLLCPGRRPTGIGPVLLPSDESGGPDWSGFAHLLGRIADTPLLPAVNLGPASADPLDRVLRSEMAATAGAGLGGEPFVAGVRAEVGEDGAFDPDALAAEVQTVVAAGGVPALLPSPALEALGPDGLVGLVSWMGEWCDRLLVVEATPGAWDGALPPRLDVFGALMAVGACIGVVHASGSRRAEWDRLRARDEERGAFQVFSANATAIDQIMYGADHRADIAAAVPDVMAERDDAWEAEDLSTLELQDGLQHLASLVDREPSSATHALARILYLRGWLDHDRVLGAGPRRPDWEDEVLRPALERLGL